MGKKEKIRLGSGHTYIKLYTGELPAIEEIEKEENLLGRTSGGASLEYTPEYFTASDDYGIVTKTVITKEEAILKLGICTFDGDTLGKLTSTARVTTEGNRRIVKIGGVGNDNGKSYAILFAHKDKKDGNIYIMLIGKNTAALTFAFAKDSETVINPEFKAEPQDDEGTLIKYIEEIVASSLSITSTAGKTTGKTAITVNPSLTSGNSYKYKIGDNLALPAYGDSCATGYTAWNGSDEITAESGKTIIVVESDSNNKVVRAGLTVIVAK